jgi:methionyl-tRNA formyltransferase
MPDVGPARGAGHGPSVLSVFLFCDIGYGWTFSLSALRFLRRRGRLTLVYSGAATRTGRRVQPERFWKIKAAARRLCIRVLARLCSATVRVDADVNAPSFRESIPPGSHGVVAGFNQIFRAELIEHFATVVNFHPSVLPLYRGPVPSYWALRNGEEKTGYTLHVLTPRIDAGPVLYQGVVPCASAGSEFELNRRIARAAVPTLEKYLQHLLSGTSWTTVTVDAHSVYKVPLDYGKRPV